MLGDTTLKSIFPDTSGQLQNKTVPQPLFKLKLFTFFISLFIMGMKLKLLISYTSSHPFENFSKKFFFQE